MTWSRAYFSPLLNVDMLSVKEPEREKIKEFGNNRDAD
jgi:hypothetical protein